MFTASLKICTRLLSCRPISAYGTALLLLLCASAPGPAAAEPKPLSQYDDKVWRVEDGLPQNTVKKVLQTRDGYIWIATEEGLARFDGARFTVFNTRNAPGLVSNNILNLLEDGEGNLWTNAYGAGLSCYHHGEFTIVRPATPTSMIDSETRLDANRRLLARLDNKIYRYQQGRLRLLLDAGSLVGATGIGGWYLAPDETLWVSGNTNAIYRHHNGAMQTYLLPVPPAEVNVNSIGTDRWGALWVASARGLFRWKQGGFERVQGPWKASNQTFSITFDGRGEGWLLAGTDLYRMQKSGFLKITRREGVPGPVRFIEAGADGRLQLRCGEMFAGMSNTSDIGLYENGRFVSYGMRDGMPGPAACILKDREGDYWIGTQSGLNCLRNLNCQTFRAPGRRTEGKRAGPWVKGFTAVFEDHEKRLWVGTDGGGLLQFQDGRLLPATLKALQTGSVMTIQQDTAGALWILIDSVPYRWYQGRLENFGPRIGSAISTMAAGSDGEMYFATLNVLVRYQDGILTRYDQAHGMPAGANWFFTAFCDHSGRLWLSTSDRILCFQDGRFTMYTSKDGLPAVIVTSFHEDRDGTLWLGHWGSGLTRYKNGAFKNISIRDGLYADGIYQIVEDNEHNLWFGSGKGIFRVSGRELKNYLDGRSNHLTYYPYDADDGAAGGRYYAGAQTAACKTVDGRLWFCALNGLVEVAPRTPDLRPMPVRVEAVRANRRLYDPEQPVIVPAGSGSLEFAYTALSFVSPHKIHFQYRLEGFDKDWIDAGTRRAAYYTNLPPGRYRFWVQASSSDGDWRETPFAVEVTLRPFFYQTYWFWSLLGVLLLGGLFGWHRGRLRLLARHNHDLEVRVAARTAELLTANSELGMAHEELQVLHDAAVAQNSELQRAQEQLAIQNEILANLAITDGLTGLKNHRAFQERLVQEWSYSIRYRCPLSILLLDVDYFKQFNDTFGHPAGDDVLKNVAAVLMSQARDSDFVARYGGEEFVFILSNTDRDGALALAERLKTALAERDWVQRVITVSSGIATMEPTDLPEVILAPPTSAALVANADAALFHSKQAGRNCVTHYDAMISQNSMQAGPSAAGDSAAA